MYQMARKHAVQRVDRNIIRRIFIYLLMIHPLHCMTSGSRIKLTFFLNMSQEKSNIPV